MNSPFVIALAVLAVTLIVILVWTLRQSQQLKLGELSLREKMLAKENELSGAIQSWHNSDNQNISDREVIYIRYDDLNKLYIYLCAKCDTVWKTEKNN